MAIQNYASSASRIGRLKGEILAHAVPVEVLGITGQQKQMPKNVGDTVVYRRWLPYGGAATNQNTINQFFSDNAGVDRTAAMVNSHLTAEGVTPSADTIVAQDITVALKQFGVLYAVTDRTVDLYEDDVPMEMKKQVGERVALVREMIRFGELKGCTNKYYGGTGTSRATVNGKLSLNLLRKISRNLQANHAKRITSILAPSPNFATAPVEASYLVFCHTDIEADIRDIPGFKHVSEYGSRKPVNEYEIGSVENFRFLTSPELIPVQGLTGVTAGVGSTGLQATSSFIDVYQVVVAAEDAWGQVALRGSNAVDPTLIMPGAKDKNDPLGQRGYIGAKFYFNCVLLNQGHMAIAEVGTTAL
jgi:N4-gp56 family major capsid protein